MTGILPGTIIPWLLGGLILLLLLSITVSFRSWREAKRSPYYFLRVQAARKMQSYVTASALLFLLTAAAFFYAWQSPTDNTLRLTVLQNAKPTLAGADVQSDEPEVVAEASPEIITINLDSMDTIDTDGNIDTAELISGATDITQSGGISGSSGESRFGPISFSTDVSSNYQPVDPSNGFSEGYFTLYATFTYQGMEEGASWSWLWKRNGQVIEGGEQLWSYGSDGPGYVYFQPEEGFKLGEYSLELRIEDELISQSGFNIVEGVAASN